jgi:hypothetical protein
MRGAMGERLSREDFDRLREALAAFSGELAEKDRHERGGTTLGELAERTEGGLFDGVSAVFKDPRHIRDQVHSRLQRWCGEQDRWRGALVSPYSLRGPGICALGTEGLPGPEELGRRAAASETLTPKKVENRVRTFNELALLCLDVAVALEDG